MNPAVREVAIQAGMELQDALAERREQEIQQRVLSKVRKEWASRYNELHKKISEEQAKKFAEVDRKAHEHRSDVVRWRSAYLATYLAGFASGSSHEPQGHLTATEAVEAAADDFNDRLTIIKNRVEKDADYFERPELLYGLAGDNVPRCQDRRELPKPRRVVMCRRAIGIQLSSRRSSPGC
jgi:hypothetical protein